MSSESNTQERTVTWNCSRCGCPIELPLDLHHPAEQVVCPNCGPVGRLVVQTFPFRCQVCGDIFSAPKPTIALGGDVWCPYCHAHYRRNKRPLMKGLCQAHGRLILVREGRK